MFANVDAVIDRSGDAFREGIHLDTAVDDVDGDGRLVFTLACEQD